MILKKKIKANGAKVMSLLLAAAFLLPLMPVLNVQAAEAVATFENTSENGEDMISLTEERSFKAMIPVEEAIENTEGITWELTRDEDKFYVDPELYPNQHEGGALGEWEAGNGAPLFQNITTDTEEDNGQNYLTVTFSNICYFYSRNNPDYSAPHSNGGSYLDDCGYFNLTAVQGEEVIGSVPVKVVPYDSYHTMGEIYEQLDEMVDFAAENTNLFVEKYSMGQSTGDIYDSLDMPYIIIADDESTVTEWLEFTELAEANPTQVLADIEAGVYDDLQVPVMFSNIHSNEAAAPDGIMDFAWLVLETAASESGSIDYNKLTGFTEDGKAQLESELQSREVVVPDLIKDENGEYEDQYLGFLQAGNGKSGVVDLDKYYDMEVETLNIDTMLDSIFLILVPEENVEGRMYMTRTASNGYDLNRDNSFQTTAETQNMQKLIATFNPVSLTEFHGRVAAFQVEPCSPPHEPNFEYDLLSEHLMDGGVALGIAAVANNTMYNSYVTPMRDYLYSDGEGGAAWSPWDDMSTSYTPQFAMLQGTVAYTVELPGYNDAGADLVMYGSLGQSDFIAQNKESYLTSQTEIFERGVENFNSNAYELVGQWFADQKDTEGAETELFRPEYDGEGENGNFYPECYIIPMDGANQQNLQAAYDMMEWLSRNDVKILVTEDEFTLDGVTYPEGTMIVSMYQAKRSVANGALYDGTLIQNWTDLYSEGITAFNETRGFDMVTVAKPADYEAIEAVCGEFMDYEDCLAYLEDQGSYFTGTQGAQVIISNVSEDSTAAVNALLQSGKTVAMVTDEESEYYGDFVCSYADYKTVDSEYVLSATGVSASKVPASKVITEAPVVYITGASAPSTAGFIWSSRVSNANWNYDRIAAELMNFATTDDPSEATLVMGASALSGDALTAVQNGTPYIGYGSSATRSTLLGAELVRNSVSGGMDCLGFVTYPNTAMVNSSYVTEGDDVLYGYGAGYFTAIPEGAQVLVQMDGTKEPMEGFIPSISEVQAAASEALLNNSVQGIAYEGEDKDGNEVNIVLFANSLTHKVHQRDEYAYISNFAFSSLLGEDYVPATSDDSDDDDSSSGSGSGSGTSKPSVTDPDDGEGKISISDFEDVDSSAWYYAIMDEAVSSGLMNGVSETELDPNGNITRAMFVTILHRAAGTPEAEKKAEFTDVASDTWYTDAVDWAVSEGIVNGVSETEFAPNQLIKRQEVAAMLYRYAQSEGKGFEGAWAFQLEYADSADVAEYAYEAICWCTMNGVLNGKDNNMLDPAGTATRAEAAAMLIRYLDVE